MKKLISLTLLITGAALAGDKIESIKHYLHPDREMTMQASDINGKAVGNPVVPYSGKISLNGTEYNLTVIGNSFEIEFNSGYKLLNAPGVVIPKDAKIEFKVVYTGDNNGNLNKYQEQLLTKSNPNGEPFLTTLNQTKKGVAFNGLNLLLEEAPWEKRQGEYKDLINRIFEYSSK